MQKRNFNRASSNQPSRNGGWQRKRTNKFNNSGRRRFSAKFIDESLFINKAVVTKEKTSEVSTMTFEDFNLHPELKKAIANRGYKTPMAIQEKAIPHILEGKDLIGLANTGTGKTGAFLIPIINKILKNPKEKLLVIAPTRELAIQIQQELFALTKGLRIYSAIGVGGARIFEQIRQLRNRPNIVIGTPGRLKDLVERKVLNLSFFNNVVLDEADQMLDMGFLPDMKYLLSLVAEKRQTLFFSATLSKEIEKLIDQFLIDPVRISLKTQETSKQVDQDVVRVSRDQNKVDVLHDLLSGVDFQKVLIFTRTKMGAEKLSKILYQRGFKTESIHGDKTHGKRQRALKMFKEDFVEILVATDVAARGLDIPNVSHVINFDIPASYEDYIHRIGRTGRADKTGKALTFVE